jgi:hypothetical protein
VADTTTEPTSPTRNKLPTGDANPNSKAARLIRNAEFEELRADRDRLKARLDAIEAAEGDVDEQGGVLNAARMRKVLGQRLEADRGPTEKELREMLVKSPKDFIAAMEDRERAESDVAELREKVKALEVENDSLRPKPAGPDKGTAKAREVIENLLERFEAEKEAKRIAQCPTCGRGRDWKPPK